MTPRIPRSAYGPTEASKAKQAKYYPVPSKRTRAPKEHEASIEWFLNGRWIKFEITGDADLPEDANLIGHVVQEDHLEELYQSGDQFFRHAGGGRGFYWTQELEIVE